MLETFPRAARINRDHGVRVVDLVPDDINWHGAFPVLSELDRHQDIAEFMRTYKTEYNKGLCYSAVQEDTGTQGWLSVAGYRIMWESEPSTLIVEDVVTQANARGSGYGRILMEDIERVGAGNGCSSLIVDLGSRAIGVAESGFFAALEMQQQGNQFVKSLE